MEMKEKSESGSVAAILQRELEPSVGEWLRRVNLISELADIPFSDADRSGHLPKLYSDLISRLRLLRMSDHPSPPTLLRTDGSGESRATLPPCLSKSHAYFRLSHSACCIFIGANSTRDGCF
jgi:hypothetical protein